MRLFSIMMPWVLHAAAVMPPPDLMQPAAQRAFSKGPRRRRHGPRARRHK